VIDVAAMRQFGRVARKFQMSQASVAVFPTPLLALKARRFTFGNTLTESSARQAGIEPAISCYECLLQLTQQLSVGQLGRTAPRARVPSSEPHSQATPGYCTACLDLGPVTTTDTGQIHGCIGKLKSCPKADLTRKEKGDVATEIEPHLCSFCSDVLCRSEGGIVVWIRIRP
jgi:hypothetical protein